MRHELPLVQSAGQGQDTFCILPWKQLRVSREGELYYCCKLHHALVADDGTPLSIIKNSLDEIWNSEEVRSVRRDMVQGRSDSSCEVCAQREADGYPTDRAWANQEWSERGWLNDDRLTVEQFQARAAADDFRDPGPAFVELNVGNLCNLKCRMCFGHASSRIAADPVHRRWADRWSPGLHYADQYRWWRDPAVLDKIFRHPEHIRQLYLIGGEPTLIKEVGDILRLLIDRGVAGNIELHFSTNGTTTRAPWLRLARAFKRVVVGLSVDGCGKLNDYIRYPSRWQSLIRAIDAYKAFPNALLATGITLQAYNILNAVEVFRFLDARGLPFHITVLDFPDHLRTEVLPPRARRLAAERLRAYAGQDCRSQNRNTVLSLAEGLESHGDTVDEERLREFLLFTNDLDVARGQSFAEACPELCTLIAQSGCEWTAAGLLAERKSLRARNDELQALVGNLEIEGHASRCRIGDLEARYQDLHSQHVPLTYLSGLLREVVRQGVRKIRHSLPWSGPKG